MGAGIAVTNATAIVDGLREVRDALDAWIVALEAAGPDAGGARERFRAARDRLLDR